MSNKSLYSVYRPKTFKEVIGHPEVTRSLKSSIEKGSNHAFCLVGPSGTGKTTLARIAALELNATVQEIDAATFTGIDAMREITKSLMYRPLSGENKVIIINECQGLSKAAWDSLLTTMEEPPAWCYWFLTTTDPAKLPPAVKTRCTTYALKPVPTKEIEELLDFIAAEEGILSDDTGAKIISMCAKEAGGSPRQAIVNLDACKAAKSREEAATLLQGAQDVAEAHELAALLIKGTNWSKAKELLLILKDQNPESVRHVVRAYVTKVVLNSDKPNKSHLAVLEAFSTPFPTGDQMSPLVLAVAGLLVH